MQEKLFIPVIVDNIPLDMEENKLYVNKGQTMAGHLCPCGCKRKITTTLHPTKWQVKVNKYKNTVTLYPSVNVAARFPCGSHYYITDSQVVWCQQYTREQVIIKREMDRKKVRRYNRKQTIKVLIRKIIGLLKGIYNLFK